MGSIDRIWYRFTCPTCGASAVTSVTEEGASSGESRWGTVASTEGFAVVSTGGGSEVPVVQSATCTRCGSAGAVKGVYAMDKPKAF
jgi:hypothetical protein